jgi:hypothetical protein
MIFTLGGRCWSAIHCQAARFWHALFDLRVLAHLIVPPRSSGQRVAQTRVDER